MARFPELRQNRAKPLQNCAMTTPSDLIDTLRMFDNGLALAELLARHPDVPRRTMQRWIKQLARYGLRPSEFANWKSRPL